MAADHAQSQGYGGSCSVCGDALSVHEAVRGGHCDNEACRRGAVRRDLDRRRAREAQVAVRVEEIREVEAERAGIPPSSIRPLVVPANGRTLAPLPKARKSDFRRHLVRAAASPAYAGADVKRPSEPSEVASSSEAPAPGTRVKAAACATCRGDCCVPGASRYAFIDGAVLARYAALHPGSRPRDVVTAYLRRIPQVSVEGSCVFHGELGCTLPRRMRSSVCNDYECGPLRDLHIVAETEPERRVLIVAASDGAIARWSLYDRAADHQTPPLDAA